MTVGQGALLAGDSYLLVGREQTFGTGVTCTAALPVLSASFKQSQDSKIVEQVETGRTYSRRILASKKLEGSAEFYFDPLRDACNYLLQNAFGGTVTSATASGDTIGASAMTHTFEVGSMDQKYKSLSFNNRYGDTTNGKVFEYNGLRVNELTFTCEIDEALKASVSMIGKDSTVTTNNLGAIVTPTATSFLTFVDGRLSVEGTFASLTASSYWMIQSVEFGINNNIKSDTEVRRIGSAVVDQLPPGMAEFPLKATVRFDTTTAFDAMLAATKLSAQLEFLGPTITGSKIRRGVKFNYPTVYVAEASEPEIGGPDEILSSEVVFHVLRDDSSAGGYAIQGIVTNNAASYSA